MDNSLRLKVRLKRFSLGDDFFLRNIDFELLSGEGIALLGASGAGKTTLLKVLDGLYKNYEGSILLYGREIRELKPREIYSKMGLLFQNPEEQLFAERVFEDVAFGPRNMGFNEEKIKKAVKEALELVQLSGFEERSIQSLSFGEKKRVALAGLLAMGHEILLLDEPTLGLDPILEKNFLELLLNLKRRGYSFIIATHNVELVPYFADKVVVLKKGEMVFYGTPMELFTGFDDLSSLHLKSPIVTEIFSPYRDRIPALPIKKEEAIELLKNYLKK
ncbi:cobalt ABC transporter ATPase [Caldimicrobium thiodismutans]|uniref:Cobalt ABC transporter ATPase n=1 Tax=Caldimicrobium thiodismutans TaxID=1653476 RepID=A0A0U5AGM8_9BACT|nr:ABC transporter ATP-binding protein [Caldimicrobium thiodismutans]BAU23139.1 cobalt ABC transporter ATPase [Caldimicrobium thiodismutans]